MNTTTAAIAKGTLGRRIDTERFKLQSMQERGDFQAYSYQHGLVIGLLIAKEIMATFEDVPATELAGETR